MTTKKLFDKQHYLRLREAGKYTEKTDDLTRKIEEADDDAVLEITCEFDGKMRVVDVFEINDSEDMIQAFKKDSEEKDRVEEPEDHFVHVHEHSYPDDSLVVEIRPEEYDTPSDRDMERLSRENAEELRNQLDQALQKDAEQEAERPLKDFKRKLRKLGEESE